MSVNIESLLVGLGLGALLAVLSGWLAALFIVRPGTTARGSPWWAPIAQVRRLRALLAQQALDNAQRNGRQTEMLDEFRVAYEQRAKEIQKLQDDVRDAVKKTRELREELIERATEDTRASVLGAGKATAQDSGSRAEPH